MTRSMLQAAVLGVAVALASGNALAQRKSDLGKREYDANCAVCHGLDGKGSGSYAEMLRTTPTNLALLTKNNGGVFPVSRMYEVIDGRQAIKAHGSREMPIWGQVYLAKGGEQWDVPYDPEVFVRSRILALIEYINRLQVK